MSTGSVIDQCLLAMGLVGFDAASFSSRPVGGGRSALALKIGQNRPVYRTELEVTTTASYH